MLNQPTAPEGAAATSTAPPSHVISLVLALAAAACGLAIALSPLLPWIESRLVYFPGHITGFSTGGDEDITWLLGPIPDGVPVSLLGLGVCVVGGLLAFLSWHRQDREPAGKRLLIPLFGLIAVLAGVAMVWVFVSYARFTDDGEGLVGAGSGISIAFLATLATGALGLAGIIVLAVLKPSPQMSPWASPATSAPQAGSGEGFRG